MQGVQNKSFDLSFDKISGISISKGFLNLESNGGVFLFINTNGGNYKAITTEERVKEIIDYYESNK